MTGVQTCALPIFARVGPDDRFEELGERAFVACEVEAKLPDEVELRRGQRLCGRVPYDFLWTGRGSVKRSTQYQSRTDVELVADLGVRLELAVERALAMAAN